MKKTITLSLAAAFLFSSCATILSGTSDVLRFESKPAGAKVYIDGIFLCTTPCTAEVDRSLSDQLMEMKLEGFQTEVMVLDTEFNPVAIINLGNPLFWLIDAASGAIVKYDRKHYEMEMQRQGQHASLENAQRIEIDSERETVRVYVLQDRPTKD